MTRTLNVGLIGTGSISRAHLPAYTQFGDKVKLTAVCDVREEAARKFADEAGVADVYTDVDGLIQHADIDAVDICTIHDQHHDQVMAVAEAGKHILLEKPMGITIEECREMVAAAEKAGITFMVAQCLRFLPHSQLVKRLVDDGEFGDIWALRSDNFAAMVPPRSEVPSGSNEPSSWYFDGGRAGGGALISQTTHHIDLFRYYIGNIVRVEAKSWTDHPLFVNGAEESIAATMEFESGAIAQVLASWSTRTPWNHHYWMLGEYGSVASRLLPGASAAEQYIGPLDISLPRYDEKGLRGRFVPLDTSEADLPTSMPFVNEILHFAECCDSGNEPLSSGKDNLETMKAVLGIYESARLGRAIELADY